MEDINENRNYCVYIHTSPSGKKYVGQTGQKPEQRWRSNGEGYLHKNKNGKYKQPAFAYAILKYGWDNFDHEIIENNLTKEEADNLEKILVEKFNSIDPEYGYNCREGGNGGGEFSEATRKKLSESHKGQIVSEETRRKISKAQKGKKHKPMSEGTKRKLSEANKGHIVTEEVRKRISESIRGENHYRYGKHCSEETKKKISEKNKGLFAGSNHPMAKSVVQYDQLGNIIRIWDFAKKAEEELGIHRSNICKCCKGDRNIAGGFIWKYYEDIEKEVI